MVSLDLSFTIKKSIKEIFSGRRIESRVVISWTLSWVSISLFCFIQIPVTRYLWTQLGNTLFMHNKKIKISKSFFQFVCSWVNFSFFVHTRQRLVDSERKLCHLDVYMRNLSTDSSLLYLIKDVVEGNRRWELLSSLLLSKAKETSKWWDKKRKWTSELKSKKIYGEKVWRTGSLIERKERIKRIVEEWTKAVDVKRWTKMLSPT